MSQVGKMGPASNQISLQSDVDLRHQVFHEIRQGYRNWPSRSRKFRCSKFLHVKRENGGRNFQEMWVTAPNKWIHRRLMQFTTTFRFRNCGQPGAGKCDFRHAIGIVH